MSAAVYDYEYRLVDADLLEPPSRLAREVDTADPDYLALRQSIEEHGQRDDIEVIASNGVYIVVDGMHRLTALGEVGIKRARVKVRVGACAEADQSELLVESLTANIQRIEQRPVDAAKALRLILDDDPGLTIADLGRRIGRPATWISQALKLVGLEGEAAAQVNSGAVALATGVALAKLQKASPDAVTPDLLDRCRRLPSAEMVPEVTELAKQAKGEQAKAARLLPKFRPLSDASAEWERSKKQETPCYTQALAWVLRQDPASLAECASDEPCPLFASAAPVAVSNTLTGVQPDALWQAALAGAPPEVLVGKGCPAEVWQHEAAVMEAIEKKSPDELGVSRKTRAEWIAGNRRPTFAQRLTALGL